MCTIIHSCWLMTPLDEHTHAHTHTHTHTHTQKLCAPVVEGGDHARHRLARDGSLDRAARAAQRQIAQRPIRQTHHIQACTELLRRRGGVPPDLWPSTTMICAPSTAQPNSRDPMISFVTMFPATLVTNRSPNLHQPRIHVTASPSCGAGTPIMWVPMPCRRQGRRRSSPLVEDDLHRHTGVGARQQRREGLLP
jgi:hypothetical protein